MASPLARSAAGQLILQFFAMPTRSDRVSSRPMSADSWMRGAATHLFTTAEAATPVEVSIPLLESTAAGPALPAWVRGDRNQSTSRRPHACRLPFERAWRDPNQFGQAERAASARFEPPSRLIGCQYQTSSFHLTMCLWWGGILGGVWWWVGFCVMVCVFVLFIVVFWLFVQGVGFWWFFFFFLCWLGWCKVVAFCV